MKVLKKIWGIIKWILLTILFILVVVIGIVFVQTKVHPDQVPSIFGYKPFIVLSGSMETEIYRGDLVIVRAIDTDLLEKGDIIAFRDEEGYVVTHRIVEVQNENGQRSYITKGDNNNANDAGNVLPDNIEGKYLYKMSGVGNVLLTMQKPITLGIVLGLIVVGGILWIVLDNSKMSKEDKKELERLRKEKEGSNNN